MLNKKDIMFLTNIVKPVTLEDVNEWSRIKKEIAELSKTPTNNDSFQLLCKRFLKWCDQDGSFKVNDELLTLIIDMRSATKNVS